MIWRYRFLFICILILFAIVVDKLFYWQIIKGPGLALIGQSQYGQVITLSPQRGEIEASDNFPLVTNQLSYLVYADPKDMQNKKEAAGALSSVLGIEQSSISAQLSLNRYWTPLDDQVNIATKKKIQKLNIQGVGFEQEYTPFYPEASMAANLIGFVGKSSNGNNQGYFGLEGYYNTLLSGKVGTAIQIHDAFGHPVLADMTQILATANGSTLVTTINRSIQFLIEQQLNQGVVKYGATGGTIAVMDPKTGAILAMASNPTFDPNQYQNYPQSVFLNPFISSTYEPGSTFKPIVMSSAFDAGLVTPYTKCTICSGPVPVGGYLIHTWNDQYFPNTTMIKVIQHSDNTGMVFVAQKLGVQRMIDYLNRFGIGSLTGIDLQGETAVPLKPANLWYPADLATTGFGQGISVTPIELLDGISAIANAGKRMQPYVVSQVQYPDGKIVNIAPKVIDQAISAKAAKTMTGVMVNAAKNGEASWTYLKGYTIAGKTGTASIPTPHGYNSTDTIASFVGFAPAYNPKFAILVIINRPSASIYGANTAAPMFYNIAKDLFSYYNIPPNN